MNSSKLWFLAIATLCASMAWGQNQNLSPEQYQILAQKNTPLILSFFQTMIEKNVIGKEHLKQLQAAHELINPISKIERDSSATTLAWAKQLDTFIQMKLLVDMKQINEWATTKIAELERTEETRKRVHEDTREIHRPMRFITIPVGKYVDEITHETFEIPPDVEIQETPVTQWQWVEIMGENPSVFVDGVDSEEIKINGEKINMRPDAPVENVSWNDVQEFIERLNEQSNEYAYELPSIQEYQALLHTFEQRDSFAECHHKRLWNLTGKYRQFTRDIVELHDTKAHLVFGGNQHLTSIKDIVLPIVYDKSREQSVGLRIIRYKTSKSYYPQVNHYSKKQLSWKQTDCPTDTAWRWDEVAKMFLSTGDDGLRWMVNHKNEYPKATQHTLDVLMAKAHTLTGLRSLKQLDLSSRDIQDVTPLVFCTNLEELNLSNNQIKNIGPLAHLINLRELWIEGMDELEDISPLQHLITMEKLHIGWNMIQDITPLAELINLDELGLAMNSIENIKSLRNLKKLTWLNLVGNQLRDISPLVPLTNLEQLLLNCNRIDDISSLAQLTHLYELELCDNHIKDITPLAQLSNLRELVLIGNPIDDLSPLMNLKKLISVDIDDKKNNCSMYPHFCS